MEIDEAANAPWDDGALFGDGSGAFEIALIPGDGAHPGSAGVGDEDGKGGEEALFSVEQSVVDVDVFEEELVVGEEFEVRVGFGVIVRVAADGHDIDAEAFDLAFDEVAGAVAGHVGPLGEEGFGVGADVAPAGFEEEEDAWGDGGFVLPEVGGVDGVFGLDGTEVEGDAWTEEVREWKLADGGQFRVVVEGCIDVGSGVRHDFDALDGCALDGGQLVVADGVGDLFGELRAVVEERLTEVIDHGGIARRRSV